MTREESFWNFWDTFPTSESSTSVTPTLSLDKSNLASPVNSYPAPSSAPISAFILLSDQEIPTVVSPEE